MSKSHMVSIPIFTQSNRTLTIADELMSPKEEKQDDWEAPPSNFMCTMCNQMLDTKVELKNHVRDHFKTHVCQICDKELIGDAQYEYHISHAHSIHLTPRRSFKCRLCLERFPSDELLKDHVKQNHHKAKPEKIHKAFTEVPVACDFCARIFDNKAAAIRHQFMTHSNDNKKFNCDYCSKGFSRKANLILHIRIHTGAKPFQCEKCPKKFANPSGLSTHRRTHTGER